MINKTVMFLCNHHTSLRVVYFVAGSDVASMLVLCPQLLALDFEGQVSPIPPILMSSSSSLVLVSMLFMLLFAFCFRLLLRVQLRLKRGVMLNENAGTGHTRVLCLSS